MADRFVLRGAKMIVGSARRMHRKIRGAYACIALAGAILMHIGPPRAVHAEDIAEPAIISNYELQTRIEERTSVSQLQDKIGQINDHLKATDSRVEDNTSSVNWMKGIGSGAFGVLGILQILDLLKSRKEE
jgi:hypothetical protein